MSERDKFKTKIQKLLAQSISDIISINDLQDRYFNAEQLSLEELRALRNYERYRMKMLLESKNQKKFDRNFTRLQVLSNIADYTEFLKERYEN